MAQDIDDAYVEIRPDISNFAAKAYAEIKAAFAGVEHELGSTVRSVEEDFDKLAAVVAGDAELIGKEMTNSLQKVSDQAAETGAAVATDITAGAEVAKHAMNDLQDNSKRDLDKMARDAADGGEKVGGNFFSRLFSKLLSFGGKGGGNGKGGIFSSLFGNMSQDIEAGAGDVEKELDDAGSKIGQAFQGITGAFGGVGGGDIGSILKIAGITVLIPVVVALSAALSQLAGLLLLIPAGLAVIGAAVAPAIVAFQGFGDAIGAGFSGDTEKFNKALAGLAPSAQQAAKEFVGLKGPLESIKADVQQAFFAPFAGVIAQLGTTLLPTLASGMSLVATQLGKAAAGFVQFLSSAQAQAGINAIFNTTAQILGFAGPLLTQFAQTFLDLAVKGLPFVAAGLEKVVGWISQFLGWLDSSTQAGGKFNGWVQDANRVLGELGALGGQVMRVMGDILGNSDLQSSGEKIIKILTEVVRIIGDFLESTKGQTSLKALGDAAIAVGEAFLALVHAGIVLNGWIENFAHWMVVAVQGVITFVGWIVTGWNAIVSATVTAWNAVTGFFVGAWNAITGAVSAGWNAVVNFFVGGYNTIVNGVSSFISSVIGFFTSLPTTLPALVASAWSGMWYQIGYFVGSIIATIRDFVTSIPGIISGMWNTITGLFHSGISAIVSAWNSIPGIASSIWNSVKNAVTSAASSLVSSVGSFLNSLPGRVSSAFNSAKTTAISIFNSIKTAVVSAASSLISSVGSTLAAFPGKVKSALSGAIGEATQVGKDIINGMINGIKALAGSLANAAANAAKSALDGAKKALGIGSPSKEFAKLGHWSGEGYNIGWQTSMDSHIGDQISQLKMPIDAFTKNRLAGQTTPTVVNANVGAQLVAYLQIDGDQLHPVVVKALHSNAQDVALAGETGSDLLARRR